MRFIQRRMFIYIKRNGDLRIDSSIYELETPNNIPTRTTQLTIHIRSREQSERYLRMIDRSATKFYHHYDCTGFWFVAEGSIKERQI